jgi:predicted ATP-grasp superfamily ATP-dependent carboligase
LTKSPSKVLVLGNFLQTITVVRSLARAGYYVILGSEKEKVFTEYSRHVSQVWRHPLIKEPEGEFITAMAAFLARCEGITLVFPVGDTEIRCLMRHGDAIPASIGLVMAAPAVLSTSFDKFRVLEIVSQLGIPRAEFAKVSDYSGLAPAAKRIGYPCVAKLNDSRRVLFGKKALILTTAADFKKKIPAWPEGNEFLILQKFASGYRHNCHFLADQGRLLAYFEQRVLRTTEWDGTGVGVDGVSRTPTAGLRKYCAWLAEKLTYSGVGCAQFLVDDQNGAVSFLEINPRLDATCALPFYCGYDFPLMAVSYAEYRRGLLSEAPENSTNYPVGKRGFSLWRDVYGWGHAVNTKHLRLRESLVWWKEMALTYFHGDFHFVWSWTDPLPAFFLFQQFLTSIFHRPARISGLRRQH